MYPWRLILPLAASLVAGCQSGSGDPPEPLDGSGIDVEEGYPEPPYGTTIGSVIQSFSFEGYVNPATGIGADALVTIELAQLHNPTGEGLYGEGSPFGEGNPLPKALMVNVSAVWCGPCKEEAATILPAEYDALAPRGMELVSVLTDSLEPGVPATVGDLDGWVTLFGSDYPSVIDPDYQMGTLFDTSQYPGNFIIDTRTMTIVEVLVGKPGASFFDKLDELLDAAP
jgi:hypothetical protein